MEIILIICMEATTVYEEAQFCLIDRDHYVVLVFKEAICHVTTAWKDLSFVNIDWWDKMLYVRKVLNVCLRNRCIISSL